MKWLLWLVPRSWREGVERDLEEERRAAGRSAVWLAGEVVAVGLGLRWALGRSMVMTDLRYTVRQLWRARWFTLAAVIMLGLGVGTNLAVFSVVDRALFRPLPFGDESRLVMVTPYSPEDGQRYTAFYRGLFTAVRLQAQAISDMAYVSSFPPDSYVVAGDAGPALVMSGASYNLLDVLQATVVRGRGFTRADAEARAPIALLTWETWQRRFGGNEEVLGRQIGSGNNIRTIAGVLPPGFMRPAMNHWSRSDGITLDGELFEGDPKANLSPGVARLADGATAGQAFSQVTSIAERLDDQLRPPGQTRGPRVRIDGLREGMFAFAHQYLWLVALAATLVVCLTAVNLAGLLLSRSRSRTPDVALRASLGASRVRILTTELAQSLIICALATGAAVLVLALVQHRLVELVPANMRSFVITGVDGRVLAYSGVLMTMLAVVGAGLPAWTASRVDLLTALKASASVPSHARAGRLGRWVVGVEAAVGIVLVAGAAVVLRSYIGLATQPLGFQSEALWQVRLQPMGDRLGGDDVAELKRYLGVLDVLRSRPDVTVAAGGDTTPGSGAGAMRAHQWNGLVRAAYVQVTDQWIETLGATLLAGRVLSADDVREQRAVAVVTRDLAEQLWPGRSAGEVIGMTLTADAQPARAVVGVLDVMRDAPNQPARPKVIAPISAEGFWYLDLILRTRNDAPMDDRALLREVESRFGVTSLTARRADVFVQNVLQQPRIQVFIFGAFALIGLLVAAVGLFAVLSFDLALRRYEFGIRASLGASVGDLMRTAVGNALTPVAIGVTVGLAAAWWMAEVLTAIVVGVDVRDPWTLMLVVATLVGTAVIAAWLPARRASRVDPAVVLRQS